MTLQSKHKNLLSCLLNISELPGSNISRLLQKDCLWPENLEGNVWNCIFGPNNNRMVTITEFDYSKFHGFRVCDELWHVRFGLRPFWSSFKIFSKRSFGIWQPKYKMSYILDFWVQRIYQFCFAKGLFDFMFPKQLLITHLQRMYKEFQVHTLCKL